jgi:hypothetical protein
MWILVVVLSFALAGALPLRAQFPPELAARTRVRVLVPDALRETLAPGERWVRGEITAIAADTLYVRVDSGASPTAIARAAIQRIDRSLGVRRPLECPPVGPVVGATVTVAGLLLGFTSDALDPAGLIVVAVVFWGGIINYLSPSECWRRVHLR